MWMRQGSDAKVSQTMEVWMDLFEQRDIGLKEIATSTPLNDD